MGDRQDEYQVIIISFSDGREVKAAIPVTFTEDEGNLPVVTKFRVTQPMRLEEDCYWADLKRNTEE